MGSWWGMDLLGYRQTAAFPAFTNNTAAYNTRILNTNNTIGLIIRANGAQTNNLQEWQNSGGTALSVVDANGQMGVQTNTPQANLDVNGTAKIGVNGSVLTGILKGTVSFPNSSLPGGGPDILLTATLTGVLANALPGASVIINPRNNLNNNSTGGNDVIINWARISGNGQITVSFGSQNGNRIAPGGGGVQVLFDVTVIQ
ncbi:hypothetical protein, partial [Hydrotalea sp.]|uniref:hypothetical protein n=1 Tax=Hydrotalea sp. TaxID=2881279 RepID=UPI002621FAEA